jgi:hypothetical protein
VKHEFYADEDGDRDDLRSEGGHHNGPVCRVCGESFCVHCSPERVDEECAGPNRDVSIGVVISRSPSGRHEHPNIHVGRRITIPAADFDDDPAVVERVLRGVVEESLTEWWSR